MGSLDRTIPRTPAHSPSRIPLAKAHGTVCSCIGLFSLLEDLCLNWVLGLLLVWDTSSGIARSHAAAYFRSLAVPDSARRSTRHRVLVIWTLSLAGGSVSGFGAWAAASLGHQ